MRRTLFLVVLLIAISNSLTAQKLEVGISGGVSQSVGAFNRASDKDRGTFAGGGTGYNLVIETNVNLPVKNLGVCLLGMIQSMQPDNKKLLGTYYKPYNSFEQIDKIDVNYTNKYETQLLGLGLIYDLKKTKHIVRMKCVYGIAFNKNPTADYTYYGKDQFGNSVLEGSSFFGAKSNDAALLAGIDYLYDLSKNFNLKAGFSFYNCNSNTFVDGVPVAIQYQTINFNVGIGMKI